MRVALEARVSRPTHTPLDGTFLAWANPPAGAATGGDYPFAFDCPDAATHLDLALPAIVTAQVAAFAQQVSLYDSPAAFASSQAARGARTPSRSFIPSGLVAPTGEPVTPPEPHALIAGHVIEADTRVNAVSGTRTGGRSSTAWAARSTWSSIPNCWRNRRAPGRYSPVGSGSRGGSSRMNGERPAPAGFSGSSAVDRVSGAQLWTQRWGLPVPSSVPLMYQFLPRGSWSMVVMKSNGAWNSM